MTCELPVFLISEAEAWDIDSTTYADCGHFVDWDQYPSMTNEKSSPSLLEVPQSNKELKRMAREGQWANKKSLRAEAYNQIIKNIHCRMLTPDATVYHDLSERLFGKRGIQHHPLPDFLDGCLPPLYCLNARGEMAVKKILICIGNQYPDITYSPTLPAIVALLIHFSEDEAECFQRACRLISCAENHKCYVDQSFLAYEASCMTFGDLAKRYCHSGHKLITTNSDNSAEVFSDWIMWIFGDLPFEYAIRVFDVFLLEGNKVLYRISLALLKQYRMHVDPEVKDVRTDIQNFVKNISRHISVEKLLEKAFSIRLFSHKELWLLQMANRKALSQRGITVMQPRQPPFMSVDLESFNSAIVCAQEMRVVWSWIPERFSLYPPVLLFSTMKHGYSLQRFYSHCEGFEPTVLLIKTTAKEVCGAFLSSDWKERKKTSGNASTFFGTGECFVFSVRPEMERYEWVLVKKPELAKSDPPSPCSRPRSYSHGSSLSTSPLRPPSPATSSAPSSPPQFPTFLTIPGDGSVGRLSPFLSVRRLQLPGKTASMFMFGNNEGFIIGGGGGQALNIDADLNIGRTEHCETFDNPPLCKENFHIQHLEVWGCQNS